MIKKFLVQIDDADDGTKWSYSDEIVRATLEVCARSVVTASTTGMIPNVTVIQQEVPSEWFKICPKCGTRTHATVNNCQVCLDVRGERVELGEILKP